MKHWTLKKLVVIVFFLLLLGLSFVVYNSQLKNGHEAEDVKARVEAIYAEVADVYNKSNDLQDPSLPESVDFDTKYCSQDWNSTLKVALLSQPDSDEIGVFEYDYWIQGQDYDGVSVSRVHVESMDDDRAVVTLMLHNMGMDNEIRLNMLYERDNWFIDDMVDNVPPGSTIEQTDSMMSLKGYMRQYIADHKR